MARQAPVDRIERRSITSLLPYSQNPRLHSPEQVNQIAASMREHGQTQLVVIDEKGEIIAGHGRVLAAEQLKLKTLMVGIATGWSKAEKRAYRIKDNQLALTSRWDLQVLSSELSDLRADSVDLTALGFGEAELFALTLPLYEGENNVLDEYRSMPEFDQPDQRPFRTVLVHFKDQGAVKRFAKSLGLTKLAPTTKSTWFPEVTEKEVFKDKRFAGTK